MFDFRLYIRMVILVLELSSKRDNKNSDLISYIRATISRILPQHLYDGFTYKSASEHGSISVGMPIFVDKFLNYVYVMIFYVLRMGMPPSLIHV